MLLNKELGQQFYFKQYNMLKFFALWKLPEDSSTWKKILYSMYFWYFVTFWMLLFDVGMIIQIAANIENVEEVIRVLFLFATAMAVRGKYMVVKIRNRSTEELLTSLCKAEFMPRNREEMSIYLKAVQLSQNIRNFYGFLSVSALSAFIMSQFINKERELPASMYMPLELNTDFKYALMYIYQSISVAVLCLINVAFDTLTASFFINLKCQLDMLAYRLENIGRACGSNKQKEVFNELKDCIVYYQRILDLSHLMEYIVSIPMSIQIACSVFVLIANFYAMSLLSATDEMGNFITFFLYQSCMLAQIFILCYYANEVSMKSSEISYNLYCSNWYDWNQINRKMVLLMMLRFESPIRITSINRCYSFNLTAFTSIVNASYKYYALLKNINS